MPSRAGGLAGMGAQMTVLEVSPTLDVIEHIPWQGEEYESGVAGQRIAIVGYSHHRKREHPDSPSFTEDVVRQVISGDLKTDSFFPRVPGYFGYDDRAAFWSRVLFFNFLPDCVEDEECYRPGNPSQIARGQERFLRIIREKEPDKVLVFTTKGWRDCPQTREQDAGRARTPLGANFPNNFSWGTYAADHHIIMAFGLRHPQGAIGQLMRDAVQSVLAMRA